MDKYKHFIKECCFHMLLSLLVLVLYLLFSLEYLRDRIVEERDKEYAVKQSFLP